MGEERFSLISRLIAQLEIAGVANYRNAISYATILITAISKTLPTCIATLIWAFSEHNGKIVGLPFSSTAVRNLIEEVLRWSTPINYMKRTCVSDVELCGNILTRGSQLGLFFGSANFDADKFDHPNEFFPERTSNLHISFGHGPHRCLGSQEARAVLEYIVHGVIKSETHFKKQFGPWFKADTQFSGISKLVVEATKY